MINLENSGLRQSKRIKDMMNPTNPNDDTSSVKNEGPFNGPNCKKPILSFLSIFCALGAIWKFATSLYPHFHNEAFHSFTTRVSNDYKRIN